MLTINSITIKEAYKFLRYMFSEEYEKAELLLNQLSDSIIDKGIRGVSMYSAKRLTEAETILEENLNNDPSFIFAPTSRF